MFAIESLFSEKAKGVKQSEISALSAKSKAYQCISLGEGLPAAELFPIKEIASTAHQVFVERGREVLQYGDYLGLEGLREHISHLVKDKYDVGVDKTEILLTTGSTMCMDLCSRLFLESGDTVLVENPSYIDAMNTFQFYGARLQGIPCDNEGMDLKVLQEILDNDSSVKLIYLIPDFQNPTGRSWSYQRRKAFVELVKKYKVVVIEDNSYGEINYENHKNSALYSFNSEGNIIFCGSFSKTFSPGMRIGWLCGNKVIVDQLELLKEQVDLHSSLPNQAILERYMEEDSYYDHVQEMCKVYKGRRDALVEALKSILPDFSFEIPKGGFFLWLGLPNGLDCFTFFEACIKRQVSFLPGSPFFPNNDCHSYVRLNFTGQSEDNLREAVKRMGQAYADLSK